MAIIRTTFSIADLPCNLFNDNPQEAAQWLDLNGGRIRDRMISEGNDCIAMMLEQDFDDEADFDTCFDSVQNPFADLGEDVKLLIRFVHHQPLSDREQTTLARSLDGDENTPDISAHAWVQRRPKAKAAFEKLFGFKPD